MKTGLKGFLILGLISTRGFAGSARSAAAGTPEGSLVLTIHVSNRAEVDPTTLIKAEATATKIFKKAGVESRWVDAALTSEDKPATSADKRSVPLSHIELKILPSLMSIRQGLPDNFPDDAMGLAPGSGSGRQWVYVFYDGVEALAMKQTAYSHADTAQILGHVIAHEIGHLLLNVQTHSATGIMRARWDVWDLQNASYGYLLFSPRQAKVIREEVGSRSR